jgi:uncharacterized protein (DUF2132 family)
MNNKLFVPKKIRVGFQNRSGTYTKKLAYVIYYDNKNVLRKEKSWNSWRDNKIDPITYDNVPTEGFVLNKNVGGARESYGWNARNEYVRIFDPRGFEFEISIANLLFILQETNSIKGKGLEGEFVYCWDRADLVLLPVSCQEYKDSLSFTNTPKKKFSAKTLKVGFTYQAKTNSSYRSINNDVLTYMGKFPYYGFRSNYETPKNGYTTSNLKFDCSIKLLKEKRFVFMNKLNEVIVKSNVDFITDEISTEQVENYASLIDLMKNKDEFQKIEEIKFTPIDDTLQLSDYVYKVNNNYIHVYRVESMIDQKIRCSFACLFIKENDVFYQYNEPYRYSYNYKNPCILVDKKEMQKSECILANGKIVDLYQLLLNRRYI